MIREYINTVLGVVVAAIVVIAVAIPIISDISQDSGTDITNPETDLHYALNQNHTINVGNPLYVDGESIPSPDSGSMDRYILMCYEGFWYWEGGTYIGYSKFPASGGTAGRNGDTITITDGKIEGVDSSEAAYDSSEIFVRTATGDWGGYSDSTVQVPAGEPIYVAYAGENTGNHNRGFIKVVDGDVVEGTVYDTGSGYADETPESIECTIEDGVVTYPPIEIGSTTHPMILAKTSYVVSETDATKELIGLVPFIMIAGLMIACVAVFLRHSA